MNYSIRKVSETNRSAVPMAASSVSASTPSPKIRYKSGKDLSFDDLLIEGQLRRGELNVVTGETDKNGNGLLRLRENFIDRMTADLGEETP